MAFCPFPAVPGGSSQGSIDWVLGESTRTSAGLTFLCTWPLPERMSTTHGFAYQHSVSCLVEDFEDLYLIKRIVKRTGTTTGVVILSAEITNLAFIYWIICLIKL